jgi:hypothetical protein
VHISSEVPRVAFAPLREVFGTIENRNVIFLDHITRLAAEFVPTTFLFDTPNGGRGRRNEGGSAELGEALTDDAKSRDSRFRKLRHDATMNWDVTFVAFVESPSQLLGAQFLLVRLGKVVPLPANYGALIDTIILDSVEELAQ